MFSLKSWYGPPREAVGPLGSNGGSREVGTLTIMKIVMIVTGRPGSMHVLHCNSCSPILFRFKEVMMRGLHYILTHLAYITNG